MPFTEQEIRDAVGDPHELAAELAEYDRNIQYYQANARRFREEYPDEWIAILHQEVKAHAHSHDDVLKELDRQGIRRGKAFIRLIEATPRTLIL